MRRLKHFVRRYWLALLACVGLIVPLALAEGDDYRDCMRGIHVDVMPIEGETWEEHSARMDEAAHRACREWS